MIEIKNMQYEKNPKYLLALFDVYIPQWDINIHLCKLLEKDGKKWIALPEKANKKLDGTWDKASPYFSFTDKGKEKRFKDAVLAEVLKIFRPEASKQASIPATQNKPEDDFPF